MSLDGFIGDVADGTGWMVGDPTYDSKPFFASIDTVLMGRRSYEVMLRHGVAAYPGLRTFVFSRTLRPVDHPEVTIVADGAAERVAQLRAEPGKDIWLCGGGELFRSLLEADLVDAIEVGLCPVLLGAGRPFLPPGTSSRRLRLSKHQFYPSGLLVVYYDIVRDAAEKLHAVDGSTL
jgi:dihydrofolate reductase